MSTTPNLGLEKQLGSEYYNVEVQNRNMDKIDTAVKGVQDKFTPDGKAINADKLGGKGATEFAPASHANNGDIHLTLSEKTKVLGGSNAWVATEVVAQNNAVSFITIPNFVFTENCTVTFKAQVDVPHDEWACIVINGNNDFVYALRTPSKGAIPAGSWLTGTNVTVTLSTVKIPLGDPLTARMGTAFYSGQQAKVQRITNTTNILTLPNGEYSFEGTGMSQTYGWMHNMGSNYVHFTLVVSGDSLTTGTNGYRVLLCYTNNGSSEMWYRVQAWDTWLPWKIITPNIYNALAGTTDFSGYPNSSYIFVRR